MKLLSHLILFIFVVLLPLRSVVANQQVAVVFNKPSATVTQFYKIISQKIHTKICHVDSCDLSKDDIAVVFGPKALESHLNKSIAKTIAVNIKQDKFISIINSYGNSSPILAIYSAPDPNVRLRLAQVIYQKSSAVGGVLQSKDAENMEHKIKSILPDAKGLVKAGLSASAYYNLKVIAEEIVGLISKIKDE